MSGGGAAQQGADVAFWPVWDGDGPEPGWWKLHPGYGPCDGFGVDGTCGMCCDTIQNLARSLAAAQLVRGGAQQGERERLDAILKRWGLSQIQANEITDAMYGHPGGGVAGQPEPGEWRPERPLPSYELIVGPNIRRWREARGLTSGALAGRCGLSRAYLWKLERGEVDNPGVATLDRIAQALNVWLTDLTECAPSTVAVQPETGDGPTSTCPPSWANRSPLP